MEGNSSSISTSAGSVLPSSLCKGRNVEQHSVCQWALGAVVGMQAWVRAWLQFPACSSSRALLKKPNCTAIWLLSLSTAHLNQLAQHGYITHWTRAVLISQLTNEAVTAAPRRSHTTRFSSSAQVTAAPPASPNVTPEVTAGAAGWQRYLWWFVSPRWWFWSWFVPAPKAPSPRTRTARCWWPRPPRRSAGSRSACGPRRRRGYWTAACRGRRCGCPGWAPPAPWCLLELEAQRRDRQLRPSWQRPIPLAPSARPPGPSTATAAGPEGRSRGTRWAAPTAGHLAAGPGAPRGSGPGPPLGAAPPGAPAAPGVPRPAPLTQIPGFPPSQVPGLRSRPFLELLRFRGLPGRTLQSASAARAPERAYPPARSGTYTARGRGRPAPPLRRPDSWRERAPHAASAAREGLLAGRVPAPPASGRPSGGGCGGAEHAQWRRRGRGCTQFLPLPRARLVGPAAVRARRTWCGGTEGWRYRARVTRPRSVRASGSGAAVLPELGRSARLSLQTPSHLR